MTDAADGAAKRGQMTTKTSRTRNDQRVCLGNRSALGGTRTPNLLIRRFPRGCPGSFRTVRSLRLVSPGCPAESGVSEGCSSVWLPAWLPLPAPRSCRGGRSTGAWSGWSVLATVRKPRCWMRSGWCSVRTTTSSSCDVVFFTRAAESPEVSPAWPAALRSGTAPAWPASPFPSAVTFRARSRPLSCKAKTAPVQGSWRVVTRNLPGQERSSRLKRERGIAPAHAYRKPPKFSRSPLC